MKNTIIYLIIIFNISCSEDYDSILNDLSYNYVLIKDEIGDDLYYEHYNINEKEHEMRFNIYKNSVRKFYSSDIKIIDYLLKYRNEDKEFCNWIKTKNPYLSTIGDLDLLTKSESALILIDNYFSNFKSGKIEIPSYLTNLSYERFIKFYNENKELNLEELRRNYKKKFGISR
ncbi:hypothetical protein [uncultured Aquimarina sp.]|uniref:hypothetical protein n=1 Tax=uncultured Aquimarina sp. TaxID=575652 RepID=UPI00262753F8|nr:hypothetical protein [uncultured Aquimarina sp.]